MCSVQCQKWTAFDLATDYYWLPMHSDTHNHLSRHGTLSIWCKTSTFKFELLVYICQGGLTAVVDSTIACRIPGFVQRLYLHVV